MRCWGRNCTSPSCGADRWDAPDSSSRMDAGAEARLTLISAPAGFGKTTLLAAWLPRQPPRTAPWRGSPSTRRTANPPRSGPTWSPRCRRRCPASVPSALPLLQSAPPPIETVLTTVLNELAAAPDDVWLVLDDYHLVDGPDIRDGMTFLLEHLPPHVHLVISTRADPLLPLARLRARGELVEIRAADLRFTPDEAAAYLNDVTGLDLAAGRHRRAGGANRRLDRRAPARRDLHAGTRRTSADSSPGSPATTATSSTTWSRRCCGINPTRFANSCCTRRFSTGSPGRCVTPSPAATTAASCSSRWSAPTCSSSPWTIGGSGTATTTCSPTCCGRTCSAEQPDQVPLLHQRASQWYERHDLAEEAVRHALAGAGLRPRGAPRWSWPRRRSAGTGRKRCCSAGCRHCPTTPSGAARCSASSTDTMLMVSGDLDAVEARLDDAERALAAVPDGAGASVG